MYVHRCLGPLAALLTLLLTSTAVAQTIFVDTSNDVIDFGGAQQVADLPGPDGLVSLPEAGLASDNTPGVQTIGFHIPRSDWQYQQFFPGRAVLRPFLGFRVFDTAIVDARTQTAFTGETNPEGGGEVVIWQESYLIDNVGGAMIGFDNSSIHLSGGSNNVIQANTKTGIEVFDSSFNQIGGANPGEGNTGGFIQIDRASNNVAVGNTVNRVRVLGWVGGGQTATGNRIGGPSFGERNFIQGLGTWNSEGVPGGFAVQLFDSTGTILENNWIGTTPDGLSQGHLATTTGILFEGENHTTSIRNNRIAGILGHGIGPHFTGLIGTAISVYGMGSGVSIVGNSIGRNANDQPVLGSVTGISTVNYYLGPVQDVVIGGSNAGEGNEIAGHLGPGLSVANTFSGVRITGNSIHDNGGLGIDLITDGFQTGVTPNDLFDADTGGNGLQNFPVLQSASRTSNTLRVVGSLNSSPSTSFTIEFFASPQCDASGFGEGQNYLGFTTVSTNSAGNAAFDVTLTATVAQGWSVTATATRTTSASTSEFSACVTVQDGPTTGTAFCFGDGSAGACPCGNSGSPGHGCQNSAATGGSLTTAAGVASLSTDTLQFTSSGELSTALSILLQGDAVIAPTIFGDGLRCVGGSLKRLYSHNANGGVVTAPQSGDPSVSLRSAALGDPIPMGATRNYQVYYRDANASFCPDPPGSTFNVSNAVAILWGS